MKAQNEYIYNTSIKSIDTNISINAISSKQLFDGIIIGSENGLYICNYTDTVHYDTTNSNLSSNIITDVKTEISNNKILVCNADGYSEFQESGGSLALLMRLNSLNSSLLSDTVLHIYPYSPFIISNDFWLSVKNHGAALVQNGTNITNYTTSNSALPSNQVNNIIHGYVTSQATTFCTDKGFAILDNGQMTVYDTTNTPLPSNMVNTFLFAYGQQGLKWIIGTRDKGIVLVDTLNTWTILNTMNSVLPSDSILFIYKLTNHNFLVSTPSGLIDVDFSATSTTINSIVDTTQIFYNCEPIFFPLYCSTCNFHIAYADHRIIEFTTCLTDTKELPEYKTSKIYFSNSVLKLESINNPIYSIELYNGLGKEVWSKSNVFISGNAQYEINNLQSGMYVVNLKTKDGQLTKKVVLNGN